MQENRLKVTLLSCLLLGGCFSSSVVDSGPDADVDVSHIPEPIPQNEPLSARGNPSSYVVFGKRYYVLESAENFKERGIASWYGNKFHGNQTSNGEIYDMYAMTAAHKNLPLPTYVRVTHLGNNRSVVVRVNDRGPFHKGRIIDLSWAAAKKLGLDKTGTAPVEVVAITHDQQTPSLADARSDEVIHVQVAAFSQRASAVNLAKRINEQFNIKVTVTKTRRNGKLIYRVRLGPFNSASTAQDWISRLASSSFGNATLVYIK
jgi:rare lipoprotein A